MTVSMIAAIVGGALLLVALIVLIMTSRLGRAQAERGAQIKVVGDQPETGMWLTPILDSVAGDGGWSYEIYDLGPPDGPRQLRVEMRTASRDALITIGVDSSRSSGTFTESDPIKVLVRLASTSPTSGVFRRLLSQPFQPAMRTWRRLIRLITAQSKPIEPAKMTGSVPATKPDKARSRKRIALVTILGLAVIATASVAASGRYPELFGVTKPGEIQSKSKAVVIKGKKPKKAKACSRVHITEGTPAKSAVKGKVSCRFAEEVRLAYINSGRVGQAVTLNGVRRPKSKKSYAVRCAGTKTVICKGAPNKAVVYLY
jgi:hypothetical protein